MNKAFNYKQPQNSDGWENLGKSIDPSDVTGIFNPRENPRVSIPSPFARFQLMQDAFAICAKTKRTADIPKRDRMLVSQTLDVLELIFEGPERQGLQLEKVPLKELFNELKQLGDTESNMGSRLLGTTLESYAVVESFQLMDMGALYILRKGSMPFAMTCPTSLVLPSPNYKYWRSQLTINGKTQVFTEIKDLHQRDEGFIRYIYTWFYSLPKKDSLDKFAQYLQSQLEYIQSENIALYEYIKPLQSERREAQDKLDVDYEPATVGTTSEILIFGVPLMKMRTERVGDFISANSDLTLKSRMKPNSKPLVLSSANDMPEAKYTAENVKWDASNPGFFYDDLSIKNTEIGSRTILPNGVPYSQGFLYEHDFLEDYIFQLPYQYNDEEVNNLPRFFNGNITGCPDSMGFIPPIKQKYFEYFSFEDLRKNMKIVVSTIADRFEPGKLIVTKVDVMLKIPVKGGMATLVKSYEPLGSDESIGNLNLAANKATGAIINTEFAVNIFPFVRFSHKEQNNYTIQLVRESITLPDYRFSLDFYKQLPDEGLFEKIKAARYIKRSENGISTVVNYAIESSKFDNIAIKLENPDNDNEVVARAMLIPGFGSDYQGSSSKSLEFSFDFGTSNSYVAVKDQSGNFIDFKLPVSLLVSTIGKESDFSATTVQSFEVYSKQELFPAWVNRAPFPIASVISVPQQVDASAKPTEDERVIPFLTASIPFLYGYEDYGKSFNEIVSGLKWSLSKKKGRKSTDSALAFNFIYELMQLSQAFAVSKNATLDKCSVVWTYPLSMGKNAINSFQKSWEEAYIKYFAGSEGSEANVAKISESIAPALYHYDESRKTNGTVVTIDIGGGTCDIVLIPDGKIKKAKLTSIGFGADCIFGRDDSRAKDVNLIKNALAEIKSQLDKAAENSKGAFGKLYTSTAKNLQSLIDDNMKSSEASGTLFNLERNEALKDIANHVSYSEWLKEKTFYHDIFQYYYAALVYFLVKLCDKEKCTDDDRPEKFYFSGSGSKMLDIIDSRNHPLDAYTTALFNHFADSDEDPDELEDIEIKKSGNLSKQITARGAIPSGRSKDFRDELIEDKDKEKEYQSDFKILKGIKDQDISYIDLTSDEVKEAVTSTIIDFHKEFEEFVDQYGDEYGIDSEKMIDDFLSLKDKTIKKIVKNVLEDEFENKAEKVKDKASYPDVPFFVVIKEIIGDVVAPQ